MWKYVKLGENDLIQAKLCKKYNIWKMLQNDANISKIILIIAKLWNNQLIMANLC